MSVTAIPIPMACSPAFEEHPEGEMQVEFGGKVPAFRTHRGPAPAEVIDGRSRSSAPGSMQSLKDRQHRSGS